MKNFEILVKNFQKFKKSKFFTKFSQLLQKIQKEI